MQQRSLIDYYKHILDRISFADRRTFRKELRKAFRQLGPEDRDELKHWFRSNCLCRVPMDQELRSIQRSMTLQANWQTVGA